MDKISMTLFIVAIAFTILCIFSSLILKQYDKALSMLISCVGLCMIAGSTTIAEQIIKLIHKF